MNDRSGTHGARLNCSKQFTVAETVITYGTSGFAQGDDFGVGSGVAVGEIAIPSATDDAAIADYDRSDRHIARFERTLRTAEGFLHPEFIGRGYR